MKKIILIISATILLFGCETFLDTEDFTKKTSGNFPQTVADAQQMLAGVYSSMPDNKGLNDDPMQNSFIVSMILSDDCLGGASTSGILPQGYNKLMKSGANMFNDRWKQMYRTIFRANMLIETLNNVENWASEEQKNQFMGEGYFIRAWAYLDMCQMFGTVPLVNTSEPLNLPRAEPSELFAQIGSDLKNAIELMSDAPFGSSKAPAIGHATKWAAEALMARAFLFYTGYYQEDAIALPVEGSISKSEVVGWLEDCINNSGHALINDFRELWPYCNEYTAPDYKYAIDNNLHWIGEEGANTETVFALKFGAKADFDETNGLTNNIVVYICPRSPNETEAFPFGKGWGNATVSPALWNAWIEKEPDDIRRTASICDVTSEIENMPNYQWGDQNRQREETGLWQKKNVSITAKNTEGNIVDYSSLMYGITSNYQLDPVQDLVLIRYSDVLLMMSELTENASYMNQVRNRVGLSDKPFTTENIRNERRWELAFEGVRYYDLLRYGMDYAIEQIYKEDGVPMLNQKIEMTMDLLGMDERLRETGGYLQIPQEQIDLSNGVLVQNPGWDKESYTWGGY